MSKSLALALSLLCSAPQAALDAGGEQPRAMNPRAPRPFFVDGPGAQPGAVLDSWLAGRKGAVVQLPFTIWRKPERRGAVGRHPEPPAATYRFDDSALGISLEDRLRSLCPGDGPCVLWLSGRVGALLDSKERSTPATFSVLSVDGGVGPDEALRARALKPPDCLAIRSLRPLHCARGPSRCKRCEQAALEPARPKLLDLCPEGHTARPMIEVVRQGKVRHAGYDVVRTFESPEAARQFAAEHAVADVEP